MLFLVVLTMVSSEQVTSEPLWCFDCSQTSKAVTKNLLRVQNLRAENLSEARGLPLILAFPAWKGENLHLQGGKMV